MPTPASNSVTVNPQNEMDSAKDPVSTLHDFMGLHFRYILVWPSGLISQWLDSILCGPREHLPE